MWRKVGAAIVRPSTQLAYLGRLTAALNGGNLPLRIRSEAGASLIPLSFGIVVPITTAGDGGLPSGRYYPQPDPSVVTLGPGAGVSFEGVLKFRPRSYNLKWLRVGYPAGSWSILVEAWDADVVNRPQFSVSGFSDGQTLTFSIDLDRVGPEGAAPLRHD